MIAEGLVRAGARVYVASRKVDACTEPKKALSKYGYCKALPCDISTIDGCKGLAEDLRSHERQLHILVNNAGVTWSMDIDEFTEKAWTRS